MELSRLESELILARFRETYSKKKIDKIFLNCDCGTREMIEITDENSDLLSQEVLLPYVNQIISALAKDDSSEFIKLAKYRGRLIFNGREDVYRIHPSLLLKWTVDHRALQCAKLLLEGKAGSRVYAVGNFQWSPIHLAVTEFLPDFVELFIKHGAYSYVDRSCMIPHFDYFDMRPLNAGVERLSKKIFWTTAESVYGLIFSFSGNMDLEQAFRAISHVMRVSLIERNREAIYHYAREGQIIELAILLYVDAISEFGILKNLSFDELAALFRSVTVNISSCSEEEMYYLADGNGPIASMDKKRVLASLLLLLNIFYQTNFSMLGYKTSYASLAKRIEDAGFRLTNATKFAKHHNSLNALLPRAPFNIMPTRKHFCHQRSESPYYLRDSPWSFHEKRGISSAAQTFQASQWLGRRFMSMLCAPMVTGGETLKLSCQEGPLMVTSCLRKMWPSFSSAMIRRSIIYA